MGEKALDLTDHSSSDEDLGLVQAQRLQQFFMPKWSQLDDYFSNTVYLHEPLGQVGGDFYWFKPINESKVLIVVGDCTGHGVEGAMTSMVVLSVLKYQYTYDFFLQPSTFIEEVHSVIEGFNEENREDLLYRLGLELCVLAVDMDKKSLRFSSSGIPVFHTRNGVVESYRTRSATDWHNWRKKHLSEIDISLETGDRITVCTDGVTDLFGGPTTDKKLGLKGVASILEQPEITAESIRSHLENWKGEQAYYDDLLWISFTT